MNNISCKWLPPLVINKGFDDWNDYEEHVYSIFKNDFIDSKPFFLGNPVNIRKHPQVGDKEQGFFHLTSQDRDSNSDDPNDRIPDLRRYERIRWPRKVIENYDCSLNCENCNKIIMWREPHKGYLRPHMLFLDYKYLVVIEERSNYSLLITAYYLDKQHRVDKLLKRYERYKDIY